LIARLKQSPELVGLEHLIYVQLTTEDRTKPDPGNPNYANMWPTEYTAIAAMTAGEYVMSFGWRVVVDGFNAGEPERDDWTKPERTKMLKWALSKNGRVALGMNESYLLSDWKTQPISKAVDDQTVGRMSYIPEWARAVPVVVTEWAYSYADTRTDVNALRVDWDALNRLYLPLNVIGWFWWCAHDNQHTGDLTQKVRPLIPTLQDYNLSARFNVEPPVTEKPMVTRPSTIGFIDKSFGNYRLLVTYKDARQVSEEFQGQGGDHGDPRYNYQEAIYWDGKTGMARTLRADSNGGVWGKAEWERHPDATPPRPPSDKDFSFDSWMLPH
jgi:hypothetical protein